jgi:hypothetical protein
VKVVITQSGKTMAEPRVNSKKMGLTDPVEEEDKDEAEVEAESRHEKEEENLGKASLCTSVIDTCYCSPIKQRSLWKIESSVASWK